VNLTDMDSTSPHPVRPMTRRTPGAVTSDRNRQIEDVLTFWNKPQSHKAAEERT